MSSLLGNKETTGGSSPWNYTHLAHFRMVQGILRKTLAEGSVVSSSLNAFRGCTEDLSCQLPLAPSETIWLHLGSKCFSSEKMHLYSAPQDFPEGKIGYLRRMRGPLALLMEVRPLA
ncbi:Hypothetical predicted protein [Marmota monax]|uniref:Uncharacterized protein n=1 Tax=Marmota monax TaxID=9995 RepID=A0A5E4AZE0_MARMO|nr:hypothetical protein GHT09_007660 [Marmota monax]VTJ62808.1 Hypothetical predicted protein [Marmota monax]